MTRDQEIDSRNSMEAEAAVLILAALAQIDKSLTANLRRIGALMVDSEAVDAAMERVRQARDMGWSFVRDNAAGDVGEAVYLGNDVGQYATDTTAIMVARSAKVAQDAIDAYEGEEISQADVAGNVLNARRRARTDGYAVNAVHGSVEMGKAAVILLIGADATKTWWSMADSLTRSTHIAAHGQTVGALDYFEVGGYRLRYPQDRLAPIWETANCRCVSEYSVSWSK